MTKKTGWMVLGFYGLLQAFIAGAIAAPPPCIGNGAQLGVDNQLILQLKKTAPLGKVFRAYVSGRVTRLFPDRTGHEHFEIQIGDDPKAVLEVVYSEDFGNMPDPSIGATVEACGDFINAYAKNGGYPPSPSGAIIHWVHQTNSAAHDAGFVLLDNVLYGYGADKHPRK